MRYIIEWPDRQSPPQEIYRQLVSSGATISQIPLAENLALPDTPVLSKEELSAFIDSTLAEKTSPAGDVIKRIRKQLNADRD